MIHGSQGRRNARTGRLERRTHVSTDCIFCRIAAGQLPATIVHEDDYVVAFQDLKPEAPTHVLVIPRRHIASVDALDALDADLVGRLFLAAKDIARKTGVAETGYRLVVNNGSDAGQTVDHVHLHVMGGRGMAWPPG
jgi:histidine triad (HIT) family protein